MMKILFVAAALAAATSVSADGIALDGSELVLTSGTRAVRGDGLLGAVLSLSLEDGGAARVRIDRAAPELTHPERPVWLYELSVEEAGAWVPVCAPDSDGRPSAILQSSGGRIAILCSAGALAKCIRFGYPPWAKKDGVALDPYWRACVRMVQADYCGGEPTTLDDMLIDYWDRLGIAGPDRPGTLTFEAGWGPDGAVCVAHTRVPQNASLESLAAACPRLAPVVGETCTEASAAAAGALIFVASRGDGKPERR